MYYLYNCCLDGTCHFMLMYEHPIQIIVVRKELNTSGGVVKHPINIKKVVAKELNTSGGVVKHPINIKKVVAKELNTSGGVVKHPISKNSCSERFCHSKKIYKY
jgi:hypothetical protein